jgi:hypothetical protein
MLATMAVSGWTPDDMMLDIDLATEEGEGGRDLAEPERRLFFAVLSDAIVRVRRRADSRGLRVRQDLLEAERWIRSDDRSWPCSFVNVCEALDIAPNPLRRAVLKWRTAALAPKRVTRRGLLVRSKIAVAEPS